MKYKKNHYINYSFSGKLVKGTATTFKFINRHKTVMLETPLNTKGIVEPMLLKYYLIIVYVPECSKFLLDSFNLK